MGKDQLGWSSNNKDENSEGNKKQLASIPKSISNYNENDLKAEEAFRSEYNETPKSDNSELYKKQEKDHLKFYSEFSKRDYQVIVVILSNYEKLYFNDEIKSTALLEMTIIMQRYMKSLKVKDMSKKSFEIQCDNLEEKIRIENFKKLLDKSRDCSSREEKRIYFQNSLESCYLEFQRYRRECECVLPEIKCINIFLCLYGQSKIKKYNLSVIEHFDIIVEVLVLFNRFNTFKLHLYLMLMEKKLMYEDTKQIKIQDNIVQNLVWKIRKLILNCNKRGMYHLRCRAYHEFIDLFSNDEYVKNMRVKKPKEVQAFFNNLFKQLLIYGTMGRELFSNFNNLDIPKELNVSNKIFCSNRNGGEGKHSNICIQKKIGDKNDQMKGSKTKIEESNKDDDGLFIKPRSPAKRKRLN